MNQLPDEGPDRRPPVVLYADLDGTLLGPGGSLYRAIPEGITRRGADAVATLHEAGVQLVLASGRNREQMQEAARILSAQAYLAELGAFLVERGDPDVIVPNVGRFTGPGTPFEAMVRSGAGAYLLERYAGRLELHTPWASQGREATMVFRGKVDPVEATNALADSAYRWLALLDNGVIRRTYPGLDVPEVHAYHLAPLGVSKATGVRLHRERQGIDRREAVLVGDSPSDLGAAAEVRSVFLVANGAGAIEGASRPGNVYLARSPGGEGFAEVVDGLLG